MNLKKWITIAVPVLFLGTTIAAQNNKNTLTDVPKANPKVVGVSFPNILSPELIETIVGQGSVRLENPSGLTSYYGYDNDVLAVPGVPGVPRMLPALMSNVEATKTEPDKNTYLVLDQQDGADPHYDYGNHFLFQGHEIGANGAGYITRINLDADGQHRISLMATTYTDANGHAQPLPVFDGSVWYPFSERLLFSAENGANGGIWQATADFPSRVEDLLGQIGQAGYEGIQADNQGNIVIAEDNSGATGVANPHAKRPNSFIYRFVPSNPSNLKAGGKLQALQVMSKAHSGAIVFGNSGADADITSQDTKDLHTYGLVFQTNWVLLHDTATDGTKPFDANALAKAKLATPFKRPENGQFRPSSNFSEFVFDETGDTDMRTEAGTTYGGFGAIFRLKLGSGTSGSLTLLYNGDLVHSGFDNCAFWNSDQIVFVEDAGDTLHMQRNGLDSAYLFDLNTDYSSGKQPIRILAEGRDPSATIDSGLSGPAGFQNEGDNEITGFHISDGDPSVRGLIGTSTPTPFKHGWRVFYTQQHGDNMTWEILSADNNNNGQNNN